MSLINDVLNDLDKKKEGADESVLGLIQGASSKSRSKPSVWPFIGFVILGLVIGAGFWAYQAFELDQQLIQLGEEQQTDDIPVRDINETEPQTLPNAPTADAPVAVETETSGMSQPQSLTQAASTPLAKRDTTLKSEVLAATVEPSAAENQPVEPKPLATNLDEERLSGHSVPSQNADEEPIRKGVLPHTVVAANKQSEAQQAKPADVSVETLSSDAQSNVPSNSKVIESSDTSSASTVKNPLSKNKTKEVRLYEQALDSFQQGDVLRSEALVDELLAKYEQPKYQALKARLLLLKSPKAMVTYLDQQKVDIASSSELLALAASAYQREDDHLRAVKAYDLLVQRQPNDGRWWLAMAFSLEALDALDKSYRAYSLALQSGTLPASGREFAARKASQIKKQLEALAKQAEEQK